MYKYIYIKTYVLKFKKENILNSLKIPFIPQSVFAGNLSQSDRIQILRKRVFLHIP